MTSPPAQTKEHDSLLARARGGDTEALEELLVSLQPQIYRFGMKMCRHPEDAEDVLQDTMITMARTFKDFRGSSSLSTWLYTIARSFCLKKRRHSKFAPRGEEGLSRESEAALQSRVPLADSQLESQQAWEQVQSAIRDLDPELREVLLLRDVEGLSAKEAAQVTGISISALKSRLHRGRGELRGKLAPKAPQPGCPDIRQIFSEHLEGQLAEDVCVSMQTHVESCSRCQAECEGLRKTLRVCRTVSADLPSTRCSTRVNAAIREALGRP